MTSLNQDIKYKLSRLNVLEKLIVVNVVVFVVGLIFSPLLSWLELPSEFSKFIFKPWTLVTYAFTHYGFWHLASICYGYILWRVCFLICFLLKWR